MNVARILIPAIILAAGVAVFVGLGEKQKEERRSPDVGLAKTVEVTVVKRHSGPLDIHVDGHVVPFREIDLSAEVAGRITSKAKKARAGCFVEEGDVLFRIDNRDYKLAVARLQKQLEQAGVAIEELDEEIAGAQRLVELGQTQLELAQKEFDRQVELHRRGVSADSERDKAQRDKITADNALTMVRNQHLLLKTRSSRLVDAQELLSLQIEKANHDLARTIITAPVDGVVVSDFVEEDDYVNVGTPLVSIEDTSAVEIKCNLRMDELYWVWDQADAPVDGEPDGEPVGEPDGEPAEVSAESGYRIRPTPATVTYELQGQDYFWEGELRRIDGVGLDERTRTVPCRVVVPHPQQVWVMGGDGKEEATSGPPALVRGMYVDVAIRATPESQLFVVPETAVRPAEKQEKVWVAQAAEKNEPTDDGNGNGNGASGTHELRAVNVDIVAVVGENAIVRARGSDWGDGKEVKVLALPMGQEQDGARVNVPAEDEEQEAQED